MTDDERAERGVARLIVAAVDLCVAKDVALRHLARELEPIIKGVEDWISDGEDWQEEACDVDTTDAYC